MFLPINAADTPVGARRRHFGCSGWSPDSLTIASTHLEITFIKNDLPTPPPPVIHFYKYVKENITITEF